MILEKTDIKGYSITNLKISDLENLIVALSVSENYVPLDSNIRLRKILNSFFSDDDADAHNCKAEADAAGYCQVCGATVYGSIAYCEERGCDPPEIGFYPY